jgi:hypothetical protein
MEHSHALKITKREKFSHAASGNLDSTESSEDTPHLLLSAAVSA